MKWSAQSGVILRFEIEIMLFMSILLLGVEIG